MPPNYQRSVPALVLAVAAWGLAGQGHAAPTFAVSFDDPEGTHAAYYQEIGADVQAAGAAWASDLGVGGNVGLGIEVAFSPSIATMQSASTAAHLVGQDPSSGVAVYEQGAAAKLTGAVPDAPAVDARITVGESYLASSFWFGPTPAEATAAAVPGGKVDAYSAFLHEFGHILGFNGWRDGVTGALPQGYESSFDEWVAARDGDLWFTGPSAEAVYGAPVPLTWGDYGHLGNGPGSGRPGQDLISDLMDGVILRPGTRYGISALDLAILADSGLPDPADPIPEPPSLALLGAGCLAASLAGLGRLRRSRQAARHPA